MVDNPPLGLRMDTIVTGFQTTWENTYWELFIVSAIGGKQWSHLLFISDSSGIPNAPSVVLYACIQSAY